MIYNTIIFVIKNCYDNNDIIIPIDLFNTERDAHLFAAICCELKVCSDIYNNHIHLVNLYQDEKNNILIEALLDVTKDNIDSKIIELQLKGFL